MNPPWNPERVRHMEMRHNPSRPHLLSHTLSQEDPLIPIVSLTDEDGSSCPIYTPVESTTTPLRSVQADSMQDNGFPEYHCSTESPSTDRRPFLDNSYTSSELSFDDVGAEEHPSGDQSKILKQKSVINHDTSLYTTGTGYIDHGDHSYSLEGESGNTGGHK